LANLSGDKVLAIAWAVGKAVLILIPVILIAAKLIPKLMQRAAVAGNEELYLLVVLAMGFATAAITQAVGLSLALGAFLAGMIVSGAAMTHRVMNQLLPLRDAFVALFFVTIGALVDPRVLISHPGLWISIVLLTMAGKFVIWTLLVWMFRYPLRTALFVGLGLTQIGEFSYVLVRVARDSNLVGNDVYNATLAASVMTIVLNGLLMRKVPRPKSAVPA
jgi:CPA2 family monovalent cation:H+ antiporter-2